MARELASWFFSSRAMRCAPSTKTPVTRFIITRVAKAMKIEKTSVFLGRACQKP